MINHRNYKLHELFASSAGAAAFASPQRMAGIGKSVPTESQFGRRGTLAAGLAGKLQRRQRKAVFAQLQSKPVDWWGEEVGEEREEAEDGERRQLITEQTEKRSMMSSAGAFALQPQLPLHAGVPPREQILVKDFKR